MKMAVLGGGLTGLTIGFLLKKKGIEFSLFEKEKECGGLMRTLRENGFTFDYGGSHVLFSKDKEALSFLLNILENNKIKRRRNTCILYNGRYVKYPFENGLADLPKKENFECLYSYIQNIITKQKAMQSEPKNLKSWFYYTFGDGISEKYLIPYNTKIWKYPVDKMTSDWASRIPNSPLEDIIKSSLGIETEGYAHQLNFYYPKHGGIQAVINGLVASVGKLIVRRFETKKIKKEGNKWVVSDGRKEGLFDKIVSTIPINELVELIDAPREVKEAAVHLKYNSLICVMVGLEVKKINQLSWLYIPDRNILPHRVSFPSNYSPYVTPESRSSVLAEVTCNVEDEIWELEDQELIERVVDDLACLKILDKKNVCFTSVRKTKYAYVINDLNYSKNIKKIKDFLSQERIDIVGRFGEFRYLNMDACVKRAIEYVESSF